jgi:hypothetical protein
MEVMKKTVSVVAMVGMTAGGCVPMLWGDDSLLSGWSFLLGFVGGIFGIWLGVVIAKRYS